MSAILRRRNEVERAALQDHLQETRPEFVKGFSFSFEEDLDGDPAVQVLVVIADGEVERPGFRAHLGTARAWIDAALLAAGIERWPYVTFRAESEVDP